MYWFVNIRIATKGDKSFWTLCRNTAFLWTPPLPLPSFFSLQTSLFYSKCDKFFYFCTENGKSRWCRPFLWKRIQQNLSPYYGYIYHFNCKQFFSSGDWILWELEDIQVSKWIRRYGWIWSVRSNYSEKRWANYDILK